MDLKSCSELHDGIKIPFLGLGTYKSQDGKEAEDAVSMAFKVGYVHIDTAAVYGNEVSVGKSLKNSELNREDVFITTKLWNDDHNNPEVALKESLKKLELDYVDLYLIHWPVSQRVDSWKKLQELKKQGLCKSIGVCNFTVEHLKDLIEKTNEVPTINQVEFSPFNYQKELLKFCKENKIQLEAYCPLTKGEKFSNPIIKKISETHEKTPAQIMLRWVIQHDVVVIPKSTHEERIIENSKIFDFELSEEEMKSLDNLDEDFRLYPNPKEYPV